MKKWKVARVEETAAQELAQKMEIPSLLAKVLLARGYHQQEIASLLFPAEHQLFDPYLLKDMDKAVERIRRALDEEERIAVYGDYDCDGMTATALLYSYLESLGAQVLRYIPERDTEGYGLNREAVRWLSLQGVQLIITVDNGISALEEIAYAKELGVDVVVTDHHQPRETLPEAAAVIDPHRRDCPSPFKHLAGVGVAFKLVCALEDDSEMMLEYYADLVAVGTIADVVELKGENRILVSRGLVQLNNGGTAGIAALLELSGLTGKPLTSESVAFGLVPRINAAGRLGMVDAAVELLLTDDFAYGEELAVQMDQANRRRKEIEQEILKDIEQMLAANPALLQNRMIVLAKEGWHHGVIGIAAAKLVERFGKPCLLLSIEGEEARGSGRSVEGFSLIEAISACSQYLTRFGGHSQAAGFSLPVEQIPDFTQAIFQYARERFDFMPVCTLHIDAVLSETDLQLEVIRRLSQLEPFGKGNETPLFGICGLLEEIVPMGGGKHLRLRLRQNRHSCQLVCFGVTPEQFPYRQGEPIEAAVQVEISSYQGEERLSVRVRDLRPAGFYERGLLMGKQLYEKYLRGEELPVKYRDAAVPKREEIAVVYRYLREQRGCPADDDLLYSRLCAHRLNFCKMRLALDILLEMQLIVISEGRIACAKGKQKVDLTQSAILKQFTQS